ncbi:MAG TPA: hypothetical protein PLV92_15640 [Pirellulaceae bacterium]|nr:hypothetical protein [Pirellulaceae bacterium]
MAMMEPLRALANPVFAFTGDDRRLVVAGQDEVVRLVGVASHEIEARLLGHAGAVVSGDLDAKGRTLYTGDERGVICKWNVDSARLSSTFAIVGTARIEHEGGTTPIERLAANYVAYRSSHVLSVAVSRRERLLAAALGDGSIIILDCENGREFARGVSQRSRLRDEGMLIAAFLNMSERRALEHANRNVFNQSTSSEFSFARPLDAHPFQAISLLEDMSRPESSQPFLRPGWVGLMWNNSGQLISIASDGHLRRWDLQPWGAWGDGFSSTSVAKRSEALGSGVFMAAAPPAGQPHEWALLVNGKLDRRDGEFRALQGWAPDAKSKDFVYEMRYAMRHGRPALVATTAAGRAVVIDSKDGSQVAEFLGPDGTRKTKPIPNATAIAQADLGRVLAGEADSPKVAIEALAIDPTGEIVATSWEHRAPAKVFGLVDGKVEQHVDLWRVSDGRPVTDKSGKPIALVVPPKQDGKNFHVVGLAFHPSEPLLAVSDLNGDVSIWDWPTRKLLRRFSRQMSPPGRILFSPDGRWLLQCGIGSEVVWWDWSNGMAPPPPTPIQHKSPHAFVQRVVEMAFSADGQWLATSGADDAVRIWDAKTRLPVAVVSLRDLRQMDRKAAATNEFDQGATGLAFSSDNRELLVADGTPLVRRYDLSALRALAKFPASRLNDLTEQVLRGRTNDNSFEPTIVSPLMPVVTAKPTD